MMSWTIELDERAIAAISSSEGMLEYMTGVALAVEAEAKRLAPVDTGNLRRSIIGEVVTTKAGHTAVVGSNVRYAIYQELGTRYHPASPFLRPALGAVGGTT